MLVPTIIDTALLICVAGVLAKVFSVTERHRGRHVVGHVVVPDDYAPRTQLDLPPVLDEVLETPELSEDWYHSLGHGNSRAVRRLKSLMGNRGWTSVSARPRVPRRAGKRRRRTITNRLIERISR